MPARRSISDPGYQARGRGLGARHRRSLRARRLGRACRARRRGPADRPVLLRRLSAAADRPRAGSGSPNSPRIPGTLVFFESPHRVAETLVDLARRARRRARRRSRANSPNISKPSGAARLPNSRTASRRKRRRRAKSSLLVGPPSAQSRAIDAGRTRSQNRQGARELCRSRTRQPSSRPRPASRAARSMHARSNFPRGRAEQARSSTRCGHAGALAARPARGELLAEISRSYLRLKGYRILARRYLIGGGEIDLIARKSTRSSSSK